MITFIRNRIALASNNESGAGFMQLVVGASLSAVVLLSITMGASLMYKVKGDGERSANTAVQLGAIDSSFKGGLQNSKDFRISSPASLDILTLDNKCIRWTITNESASGKADGTLTRVKSDTAIPAGKIGAVMKDDVRTGAFSVELEKVVLNLGYGKGESELIVKGSPSASSGSGECW